MERLVKFWRSAGVESSEIPDGGLPRKKGQSHVASLFVLKIICFHKMLQYAGLTLLAGEKQSSST